jgi:hypothetical protein
VGAALIRDVRARCTIKAAFAVWCNDLRSVVRDRTVGALLAVPVAFVLLLRIGVPILEDRVPAAAAYESVMVGLAVVIAGMIPAFMLAFLLLDERDQGLFPAFRVLPVAPGWLLAYRLAVITVLGYATSLLLILGTVLADVPAGVALVLAVPCALQGPAATLVAVALAKNKIEGLAVFKGLFFVLALGAPGALPIDEPWVNTFGIIPAYWIFSAVARAETGVIVIAIVFHIAVMAAAYLVFRRRIY